LRCPSRIREGRQSAPSRISTPPFSRRSNKALFDLFRKASERRYALLCPLRGFKSPPYSIKRGHAQHPSSQDTLPRFPSPFPPPVATISSVERYLPVKHLLRAKPRFLRLPSCRSRKLRRSRRPPPPPWGDDGKERSAIHDLYPPPASDDFPLPVSRRMDKLAFCRAAIRCRTSESKPAAFSRHVRRACLILLARSFLILRLVLAFLF